MKLRGKKVLSILLALCVMMGLMAIVPFTASAAEIPVVITEDDSVADIKQAIEEALGDAVADDVVVVTGSKTDVDASLELAIPADVTLLWQAKYAGEVDSAALIVLSGSGSFDAAEGADIQNNGDDGDALVAGGTVAVAVTGGWVKAVSGKGISAAEDVTVFNGLVSGTTAAIEGKNVSITDGTVEAYEGTAILASGNVTVNGREITGTVGAIRAAEVTVSAGDVEASAGTAIVGTTVIVEGGTVTATAGTAITATGDIHIEDGTITGTAGAVKAQNAIVENGTITATNGIAIAATANVTVNGGSVKSDSGVAVNAAGSVSVTGGNVTGATTAIYSVGNVTVAGGTIKGGSGTYDRAIMSGKDVLVTGGTVSANTAIELMGSKGAALYLAGTCSGKFVVTSDGIIVEVDRKDIPTAYINTATGLAVKAESYMTKVEWILDGTQPKIKVTLNGTAYGSFDWGTLVMPALSESALTRTSDTAASVSFKASVDGTAYIINLSDTSKTPAASVVRAGKSYGAVSEGTVNLDITLEPGARSVYVIIEDKLGNQSEVLKIEAPRFVQSYLVTVESGTGGGKYVAGAKVSITAQAPAGQVFDKWTTSDGVIFVNAQAAETAFTMLDKDVTVTANYKPVKYVGLFGLNTKYESTTLNWIKFIVLFGWIWMWF